MNSKTFTLKYILLPVFFLFLLSCNSNAENRVTGDNLTVYFPEIDNQTLAEQVAVYWRENDLVSGEKQALQVVNTKEGYQLNIIQSEAFKNEEVTFEDQKLLYILKDSLENIIFNSNLTIAICNNKFESIYKVN